MNSILHRVGNLTYSTLHLIHADEVIEILEDILDRALLWYITLDISLLYNCCLSTTCNKLSEDILCSLRGEVSISKGLIFYLHLIFEETLQLILCLWCEVGNTITGLEVKLTYIRQFLISWGWKTEPVLETVCYSRVALKEVIESLRKTGHNHNRIVFPLIHLNKELIERIYLI